MNFIKKLVKTRDEIRAMNMTREEAERIAYGYINKMNRKQRRAVAVKIKKKLNL